MKRLFDMELHANPLLTETKIGRVHGGYMNRWLIRAMVTAPSKQVIVDNLNNRIYAHPEMINEISREFQRRYPKL